METKKINIGLIGFGTVGQGVAHLISKQKSHIRNKLHKEFHLVKICDRSFAKRNIQGFTKDQLTKNYEDILNDPKIHVVIELIGGLNPAKDIVVKALKRGKHVITANKDLIANSGNELFQLALKHNCRVYYESSVGAGIPIINTITEGIAGNEFKSVYGIVNGTCNYILTEMTKNNLSFDDALKQAQKNGYAESDPTKDINGMDSTHKLAILINLAFGKQLKVADIYTEGITDISHEDIANADELGMVIKLLAIAKQDKNEIEAHVHPTLISKEHPLASINDVYNAIFVHADPLGEVLLSGEGAGQMAAASGVYSDLINLATSSGNDLLLANHPDNHENLRMKPIDQIQTKFYIRMQASDKPGVLSKVSGILGQHKIGINSVTQEKHTKTQYVPVVMMTDFTTEKQLRLALGKIQKLPVIKSKPVAIRVENLA
ncbi:MAG: homoserine dehydrogenase [Candidatus Omnitrophica bacterium]|nr:homoserine dehydrogenase [Candidatus Omnitrophota bacterium]